MKKALVLTLATVVLASQSQAQSLFTTTNDFSGWGSASGGNGTPTTAYSYDSSTVNGMGNNPGNSGGSINAGGVGVSGSLLLNHTSTNNFDALAFSPGEAYNGFFMHTIDPGSTTAFSPESGFGSGTTVSYAGTIQMVYSVPDNEGGTFFQLGLDLAYDGSGFFSAFFGSATDTGTVDENGNEVWLATIPYTINAGSLNGFAVGILYNSDYSPVLPFTVDAITVVPEPSSMALAGLGIASAFFMRRRKA